jgi:cytochrome c oxidase subunit 2
MQYKHILAVAAVASLAACTPASPDTGSGSMMGSSSSAAAMEKSSAASIMEQSSAQAMEAASSAPAAMEGDVRVVDVTVTDWSFTPATVTAKQGEKVQLRLKDEDGIHSLLVADLGVNVRVSPGETTVVDLATDKVGTFEGRCGVPCGPGHRDMKFTIVVE